MISIIVVLCVWFIHSCVTQSYHLLTDGDRTKPFADQCRDIHTIAGVLKLFFRLLPIPLITFDVYYHLISTISRLRSLSLARSIRCESLQCVSCRLATVRKITCRPNSWLCLSNFKRSQCLPVLGLYTGLPCLLIFALEIVLLTYLLTCIVSISNIDIDTMLERN